jgi:hypothetical protein
MSSIIRLPIRALLEFYDEAPDYARGHATALNAVLGEELGKVVVALKEIDE